MQFQFRGNFEDVSFEHEKWSAKDAVDAPLVNAPPKFFAALAPLAFLDGHRRVQMRQGVEDDAMNVLALGARVIGPALAVELVGAFLRAQFSGAERHRRRLAKIESFERG